MGLLLHNPHTQSRSPVRHVAVHIVHHTGSVYIVVLSKSSLIHTPRTFVRYVRWGINRLLCHSPVYTAYRMDTDIHGIHHLRPDNIHPDSGCMCLLCVPVDSLYIPGDPYVFHTDRLLDMGIGGMTLGRHSSQLDSTHRSHRSSLYIVHCHSGM
ncbi:hypothetical protein ORF023L [Spotted knifejaw iridovirus]|nr:hypothetical protein ORF023L [Spotted knifejaw iridovirus]